MASAVKTLLWAWLMAKSVVSPVALPEITDEEFIDECVREHNRARWSVTPAADDMRYMTWDMDLAAAARDWARRCLFEHNPDLNRVGRMHPNFSSVGENLWTGSPTLFKAAGAIQAWVDEKENYDYDSNVCTDVCGHYKQVVWAQTHKVGCAAHFCPNGVQATAFADEEGIVFVCNYAPAGGVNGQQPYRSKSCPGCEDVEKVYRFVVDNDRNSLQNPSDLNYALILIIRSLGLVATLATAYGFQNFYPNIFCYE